MDGNWLMPLPRVGAGVGWCWVGTLASPAVVRLASVRRGSSGDACVVRRGVGWGRWLVDEQRTVIPFPPQGGRLTVYHNFRGE
jgi:hypothetical protein